MPLGHRVYKPQEFFFQEVSLRLLCILLILKVLQTLGVLKLTATAFVTGERENSLFFFFSLMEKELRRRVTRRKTFNEEVYKDP